MQLEHLQPCHNTMEATKNGLVLIVSETYTDSYVGTSTMYMKFYNITKNSFMLDISGTNLDGKGTNMELTTFNFTKFVG